MSRQKDMALVKNTPVKTVCSKSQRERERERESKDEATAVA
jgi:hypothetical protein